MSERDDLDLDAFFKAAKEQEPEVPMHFLEAVVADAAQVSTARMIAMPAPAGRKRWRLSELLEPIGGRIGAGALAACAVFGVSAGYAGTSALESVPGLGTILSSYTSDVVDDYAYGASLSVLDTVLTEG